MTVQTLALITDSRKFHVSTLEKKKGAAGGLSAWCLRVLGYFSIDVNHGSNEKRTNLDGLNTPRPSRYSASCWPSAPLLPLAVDSWATAFYFTSVRLRWLRAALRKSTAVWFKHFHRGFCEQQFLLTIINIIIIIIIIAIIIIILIIIIIIIIIT